MSNKFSKSEQWYLVDATYAAMKAGADGRTAAFCALDELKTLKNEGVVFEADSEEQEYDRVVDKYLPKTQDT